MVTVKVTVTVSPDRKSTRLNSSHANISYAVFCLKKKKIVDLLGRVGPHSSASGATQDRRAVSDRRRRPRWWMCLRPLRVHELFFLMLPPPPSSTLFPYTTLFR